MGTTILNIDIITKGCDYGDRGWFLVHILQFPCIASLLLLIGNKGEILMKLLSNEKIKFSLPQY